MKNLRQALSIFLLTNSLFCIGCTSHEGPTYGEKLINNNQDVLSYKLNTVAILDKEIQKWNYLDDKSKHITNSKISIENLGIKSLSTNNVEAFTTIRNRTDYPLQLKIRTQFYDDNKIATEDPSSWKRIFLPQNSSMTYKEKSITINEVSNFLIEIKEGE